MDLEKRWELRMVLQLERKICLVFKELALLKNLE
jgi:hypothetical protein